MKLKHLTILLMLLALGCSGQSGSDSSTPATGSDGGASVTVGPETETQLASTTVKFDVTGMT